MRKVLSSAATSLSLLLLLATACTGQTTEAARRPPAVPLVTHDPYFSIWSMADKLTDQNTRHWTGTDQPLTGLIRIDGTTYRYMGARPRRGVPAMAQTALNVSFTHTDYTFEQAGVRLRLSFFTPAFADDLDVLSRPVTYLTWNLQSTDGSAHKAEIYLDVSPALAVDTPDQQVTWSRARVGALTVLSAGSREQHVLGRAGDNLRIDWGYVHLATPDGEQALLADATDSLDSFIKSGKLPDSDSLDMPAAPARDAAAHLALEFPVSVEGSQPLSRHALLSYTEGYSIEFLNRKLRPYWQRNNETAQQMLQSAEEQYQPLEQRGRKFDKELAADMTRVGGAGYAELTALAYRQTLAAHGFAADLDGRPVLFPKENFSNGCISTVDVLYPSSPFFLFFSPTLLEAQLQPVLEYSALPRWKWPFAPHDLGTYPLADGQVYGGGERTEEDQMPVEETGNMLIMLAALGREQGNWHVARQYWPQLTKWADYLREKGLDPENQLSTDDFAGHLAHNANLSIKAIEGLAAFADMAKGLGDQKLAQEYETVSHQMAKQWETMGRDGDHYKLAFDKPGTWSQKYNLVWDQLLHLNLFPPSIRETEMAFYLQHLNRYGLPLDNRADYTKLDWQIWTATLTNQTEQFNALMAPIHTWMNETPTHVPLTDWYDTRTGKQVGFQARSVVGGVFIKALADESLAKRWRNGQDKQPTQ